MSICYLRPCEFAMLAYMVPKKLAPVSDGDARLQRARLDAEWKQAEAERLSLLWPRPRKRAAGRPSRQQLFSDAIYKALEVKSLPGGLESSSVPGWWQPGMALVRTVADVREEMVGLPVLMSAAAVEANPWQLLDDPASPRQELEAEAPLGVEEEDREVGFALGVECGDGVTGGEQEEGQAIETPQKVRRKKVHVAAEVRTWFLEYAGFQKTKYGWPLARSLRQAKELAPELFRDVHKDTPMRWAPARTPSALPDGLPCIALTKFADIARATSGAVALSAPLYLRIFSEQLKEMDIEYDLQLWWVRQFLRSLGLAWGSSPGDMKKKEDLLPESIDDARENFRLKIVFFRHHYDIAADRVVNIDQTSVRVLPTATRGWRAIGQSPGWAVDTKRQMTVVLACFMERADVYAQMIFKGKTAASHPVAAVPGNMTVTHTENHWSSAGTMLELVGFLDSKINATEHDAELPWVLGLDVAPVHVSKEFRAALAEQYPWVKTPYIKPRQTFCAQPLDLTYMRSFKSSLSDVASADFARQLVRGFDENDNVQFDLRLSILKPKLVLWVGEAIAKLEEKVHLRENGWKYVRVPDECWEDAVALADCHHAEGRLFQKCQTRVVPDFEPDHAEDDVPLAAHVNPGTESEAEDCGDDGETHHDVILLADAEPDRGFDAELGPDGLPEVVAAPPTDDAVAAEVVAPPPGGDVAGAAEQPKNADLAKLERLMALRLVYGRGPPALKK